jgi:hypothetical protein
VGATTVEGNNSLLLGVVDIGSEEDAVKKEKEKSFMVVN